MLVVSIHCPLLCIHSQTGVHTNTIMADKIPAFVKKFMEDKAAGRLSTKDRQFTRALDSFPDLMRQLDMEENMSAANVRELMTAIATTKDKEVKEILKEQQQMIFTDIQERAAEEAAAKASASNPIDTPSLLNQLRDFLSNAWSSK